MTQEQRVLDYMRTFGSITQLDAMRDLGVMRLASRVSDLRRDGHLIKREIEKVKNRYGEVTFIARYMLVENDG